jgi:predicted permease
MQLFLFLVAKLIPLYLLIAVGFVAAKYLNAKKETLASLLIYVIAPVVVFYGVATTKLTVSALALPIIFFVFSF